MSLQVCRLLVCDLVLMALLTLFLSLSTEHVVFNLNFGFEQFATAAGIYAATNPFWPWITFQ